MMGIKFEDFRVHGVFMDDDTFDASYVMKLKSNNKLFVWNVVDYSHLSEKNKKLIISEINLLVKFNHPNVVKYHTYILSCDTTLYIVSEWCQGEDLATLINRCKRTPLSEELIWQVLYQVSKAVQACRRELGGLTVLSFEIKPGNIIIMDSDKNCVLGNFGLAKNEEIKCRTRVGTSKLEDVTTKSDIRYLANMMLGSENNCTLENLLLAKNETINKCSTRVGTSNDSKLEDVTAKSDVRHLGRLVYQLCTLSLSSKRIDSEKCEDIPSFYSRDLRNVLSLMFSSKKNSLTSVDIILNHSKVLRNVKASVRDSMASNNLSIPTDDEKKSCAMLKRTWFEKVSTIREKESELNSRQRQLELREKALLDRNKRLNLLQLELEIKLKSQTARNNILKSQQDRNERFNLLELELEEKLKSQTARNKTLKSQLHRNNNASGGERGGDADKFDLSPKLNYDGRKFPANKGRVPSGMREKSNARCITKLLNQTTGEELTAEYKKMHQRAMLLQQTEKISVTPNYYHDETFRIVEFHNTHYFI